MWKQVVRPTSLDEALTALANETTGTMRVVAGGTDVLVELQRGINPAETLLDLSGIPGLADVALADGIVTIGGRATHNDVLAAPFAAAAMLPLAQACIEVGAPQIRARGTIAGNLVTASPANDTIAPLLALDAELTLVSVAGEHTVPLGDFYTGFRATVLRRDELVRAIRFRALDASRRGIFLKLGLRRAQAISVIDVALVASFAKDGTIAAMRVALGCLAPTVVRSAAAESFLVGKRLDDPAVRAEAGRLACTDASAIGDLRGSAAYRLAALAPLVADGLTRIAAGDEAAEYPERPVLLRTLEKKSPAQAFDGDTIATTINGERRTLVGAATKTLLDALRENAGLTGSKEGCGEGECGACTLWLDGSAVMACLVPATQAHGATVTTIEGLASGETLHPLQQAYVDHGAVQCGFCIPGMLMAGAKLLAESAAPTLSDCQAAISGNLCRCTGYRKILDAMEAAAAERAACEPQPDDLRPSGVPV